MEQVEEQGIVEHERRRPDPMDDETFTRLMGVSPDAYGRMLIERSKEPADVLYRCVIRGEQILKEELAKAAQQSYDMQQRMQWFEWTTGKSVYSRFLR